MSTLTSEMFPSTACDVPRAELNRSASVMLVAFVAILATIVFTMPITESWKHSTYEHFDNTLDEAEASVRDGSLSRQIAIGSLGLLGLAAIAWPDGKRIRVRTALGAMCVAYLAWCLASCLWSDDVSLSLRRWVALGCEVAAGVAIAKRSTARQFVWIVFSCTLAWLSLGILAELSQGTFRPLEAGHRFAGLFHPNIMGVNAALLTLSSLYSAIGSGRRRWFLISIAAIGFAFLFLTRSRTSMAAMLAAIAVMWIFTAPLSRRLGYLLTLGLATACVAMAIGLGAFEIPSSAVTMGRAEDDAASFTGRVPLWQELIEDYLPSREWVGYGYGAFWTSDRIAGVSKSQNWAATHAHSTYIDLMLNIGVVGAVLCVLAMVGATVAGLRRETRHAGTGYGFIAMILVFGLTAGLLETYVGHTWFLSFFGICGLCYFLFDEQQDSQTERREEFPRSGWVPPHRRRAAISARGL